MVRLPQQSPLERPSLQANNFSKHKKQQGTTFFHKPTTPKHQRCDISSTIPQEAGSAPSRRSAVIIRTFPSLEAAWSGVHPSTLRERTLPPAARTALTFSAPT